jgi:hypothetical protein
MAVFLWVDPANRSLLGLALMSLGVPRERWGDIFNRWRADGGPILQRFAPYAAHCMNVELFFSLAVGADLIAISVSPQCPAPRS